ncbi:MAG: hypothetical protein K2K83_04655, partial [Rikenella sp.]|nr:hypothetical protein [Rikenella sp.]
MKPRIALRLPAALRRTIRKIVRVVATFLSAGVIVAVVLPILVGLLLQLGFVQNYAVRRLAEWLSERGGTTISIDRVEIGFFNRAILEGIYVEDPDNHADTLLYASRLSVGIDGLDLLRGGDLALGSVSLTDGVLHVAQDSTGGSNLGRLIARFQPNPPRPLRLELTAREVNLIGMRFTYRQSGDSDTLSDATRREAAPRLDFRDLDLREIHFQARKISVVGDSVEGRIEHLTFREKSGFHLQHLSSPRTTFGATGLRIAGLRIETPLSLLQFERLNLLYDDRSTAFRDFWNQVRLDIAIDPSALAYRTIRPFLRQSSSSLRATVGFE